MRWIYDIGSRSLGGQSKLASAIDRFMRPRMFPAITNNTVDVVFISHFDQDHVNGIPLLKKKGISVKEFVIPALNDQERIISLVDFTIGSRAAENLLPFFLDPQTWLKETFGADTVVRQVEPMNSERTPLFEEPLLENTEDTFSTDRPHLEWPESGINPTMHSGSEGVLSLGPAGGRISFRPFYFKQDLFHPQDFMKACQLHFGTTNCEDILNDLKNGNSFEKVRKDLRGLQKVIAGNVNRSSLCLLINYHVKSRYSYLSCLGGNFSFSKVDHVDWIGTGDVDLKHGLTKTNFYNTIRPTVDRIITFQIPHHGSGKNFDIQDLKVLQNVKNFVVPYGTTNGYGHPSSAIKGIPNLQEVTELSRDFIEAFLLT
ncbi:hypothetical protein DOE51_01690 [Bdellovibrio sp. NC01]|nr:hypothetical protein DOE51_01690 [Bdellovibrio sp. NC01]